MHFSLLQTLAGASPSPIMSNEGDSAVWLLNCLPDAWKSPDNPCRWLPELLRDSSPQLQTVPSFICTILDEIERIESADFKPEAASAASAKDLGDSIQGKQLPQDADLDSAWSDRSEWSEWSEWSEEYMEVIRRNPQKNPGLLDGDKSFRGSHHDPRHEIQSDFEGAWKRRKNICGFFVHFHVTHSEHSACERSPEQAQEAASEVKACPVIKAGRSSNSCPTLIRKLELRYGMKVEAESFAAQNIGDEAQPNEVSGSSMAKNEVSTRCSWIQRSTLGAAISFQNQTEMRYKMPLWKSIFEVKWPRVLNDGQSAKNVAQVPNWNDEELSALLLSKIKELEGGYGHCTTDQGLWGRTPLGKMLEDDIAAKGRTERLINCPTLFYNGLVDSPMEQTDSNIEEDRSQNFASSYSLEGELSSGAESSATSDPQAEGTGESCNM